MIMRVPALYLTLLAGVAALLVMLAVAWPDALTMLQTWDEAVWRWAVRAESVLFVNAAEFLDIVGGRLTTTIVTAIAGLTLWRIGDRISSVSFVVAIAASATTSTVLKLVYARPRPPMPLHAETTWAFPSGHAVAAAALAVAVFYLIPRRERGSGWLVGAAWLYVALMAASRVYLRVHWLSDVVAGALIGFTVAASVILIASGFYSSSTEAAGADLRARGDGVA